MAGIGYLDQAPLLGVCWYSTCVTYACGLLCCGGCLLRDCGDCHKPKACDHWCGTLGLCGGVLLCWVAVVGVGLEIDWSAGTGWIECGEL